MWVGGRFSGWFFGSRDLEVWFGSWELENFGAFRNMEIGDVDQ